MKTPATATALSRPGIQAEVWITKQEAAQLLAISRNGGKPQPLSERRILEYTGSGALRSAKQRHKSGQQMVVVSREDVLKLKQERENPVALPAIPREIKPKLLAGPSAPIAPVAHTRAWLNLAEAEEYTGLPETFLLARIDAGILPALNVGVRAGGRWRVKRADLDAIGGVVSAVPRESPN